MRERAAAARRRRRRGDERRAAVLAALVLIQALCAVFFMADAFGDVQESGLDAHTVFEGFIALALIAGVIFGGLEMRRTLEQTRRAEDALAAASGAFAALIEARFDEWRLTPAESEVALLALKGFGVAETAKLRGAASGTVRAQLTRIYSKAGVTGRTQFVCLFIDDLLAGPVHEAPVLAAKG